MQTLKITETVVLIFWTMYLKKRTSSKVGPEIEGILYYCPDRPDCRSRENYALKSGLNTNCI